MWVMLDKDSFKTLIVVFVLVIFIVVPIASLISWGVMAIAEYSLIGGLASSIVGLFALMSFTIYLCDKIVDLWGD